MSRSKQRAYTLIVAGGLCALAGDMILRHVGSPTPASAAADVVLEAAAASQEAEESVANVPPLAAMRFPSDLPNPDPGSQGRDPFALTEQVLLMLTPPAPTTVDVLAEAARPPLPPADLFQRNHRLSAVLRNGDTWIAIIDGVAVLPEQVIDGCELVEVRERAACFACPDGKTELPLNEFAIPED